MPDLYESVESRLGWVEGCLQYWCGERAIMSDFSRRDLLIGGLAAIACLAVPALVTGQTVSKGAEKTG